CPLSSAQSAPVTTVRLVGSTGFLKKIDQGPHLRGGKVAELPGVAVANVLRQSIQQLRSSGSDVDHDGAAVIGRTIALDELALVELIEKSGDVRSAGDQPCGDAQRGDCFGLARSQQPQGVVLPGGEPVAGEKPL